MIQSDQSVRNVAFIGFGEAATAFLTGWADGRPTQIAAFDVKTDAPTTRTAMMDRYKNHSVTGAAQASEALDGAGAVFCLITADRALEAARASADKIGRNALWLDGNSCAPDSKRQAAEAIEAAGGRYVDVAIMAPVYPKQHHVPILLSGPHAAEAEEFLRALDMRPKIAGDRVGEASSIKMLRSVMIKGLEALTAECFLAARRAGVEDAVIASLEASDPEIPWRKRGAYNLERMMVHGARRAAEMSEVAKTVDGLGLLSGLSSGAAAWQDAIGGLGLDAGEDELLSRADAILSKL